MTTRGRPVVLDDVCAQSGPNAAKAAVIRGIQIGVRMIGESESTEDGVSFEPFVNAWVV